MNTKQAKALCNLWSTKSGHSCCIDEKVWHFQGQDSPNQVRYSFTHFTSHYDCTGVDFNTFNEVVEFINSYIKEA